MVNESLVTLQLKKDIVQEPVEVVDDNPLSSSKTKSRRSKTGVPESAISAQRPEFEQQETLKNQVKIQKTQPVQSGPLGIQTSAPDPLRDTNDEYLMKLNNELNLGVALVQQMKEQNEDEQKMLNDGIGNNGLQPLNPEITLKNYDGIEPKFARNKNLDTLGLTAKQIERMEFLRFSKDCINIDSTIEKSALNKQYYDAQKPGLREVKNRIESILAIRREKVKY